MRSKIDPFMLLPVCVLYGMTAWNGLDAHSTKKAYAELAQDQTPSVQCFLQARNLESKIQHAQRDLTKFYYRHVPTHHTHYPNPKEAANDLRGAYSCLPAITAKTNAMAAELDKTDPKQEEVFYAPMKLQLAALEYETRKERDGLAAKIPAEKLAEITETYEKHEHVWQAENNFYFGAVASVIGTFATLLLMAATKR